MKIRYAVAIAATALLAGCASHADVQRSAPLHAGNFTGSYQSLAVCIVRAWNGHAALAWQVMDDRPNRVAYLTYQPGPWGGASMETTVRQVGEDQVRVEYRTANELDDPAYVWESVEACGAQQRAGAGG